MNRSPSNQDSSVTTSENYQGLLIKIIKEPLLHFLLIGALIFGFYAYLDKGDSTHQITLSPASIHRLETAWEIQWRRPPTEEELANLVKNNLKTVSY
jgi:hypothetical protein